MARIKPPKPTDAELAILRVLWDRGPSTVRQVLEELSKVRPTGYTTVLKFLQIMTEKGLVTRDATNRTHVYQPRLTSELTKHQVVRDVLDKVFGGSSAELVAQTLAAGMASAEELRSIRKLLDELERGSR